MAVDLSVFDKQKTVLDQQALQEAFQLKKALAIQAAQRDALETQALQAQAANGGLTLKDMLTMQMQQQNNQENRDIRREALDIQRQNAEAALALRKDALDEKKSAKEEKKDLKFRNDQNLLNNATSAIDKQISYINSLFDGENLKPDVANVYGTTFGYQTPIVRQGTRDAKAKLDQVNAGAFISALGDMKNQSATGASGLGALSEREGDKVQSAATSAADTKQSPESAAAALKLYRDNLIQSKKNLLSGFQNIYKDKFVESTETNSAGQIPEGAVYLGTQDGKPVYKLPDGRGWTP